MLGAPILSAAAAPSWFRTTEGGTTRPQRRHGFRSVHRKSGRHGPIGVFERRADQRHSAGSPERADDEDAGPRSAPQSGRATSTTTSTPAPSRLNRNNFDAKVNWNRNERHQLWFKYSVMNALVHGEFGLGEAGGRMLVRRRRRRRPHAGADRRHRADLYRLAQRS